MKIFIHLISLFISFTILTSCNHRPDFIGSWEREISDKEYIGKEKLDIFQPDSIIMGSQLIFKSEEDGFSYQIKFDVCIKGKCLYNNNGLSIYLDISSFQFNEIPNSFHVYLTKGDNEEYKGEYLNDMKQTLITELKNRFFNFYNTYNNSPYYLKNIKVKHNILFCTSAISQISFEKVPNS